MWGHCGEQVEQRYLELEHCDKAGLPRWGYGLVTPELRCRSQKNSLISQSSFVSGKHWTREGFDGIISFNSMLREGVNGSCSK